MSKYSSSPIEPGNTYHIYTHANGSDLLFKNDENFQYFMDKYKQHITPIAETFCYCLMPNHIHFLLRIKKVEELIEYFDHTHSLNYKTFPKLISKKFSNLFNSYAQAYNKQENRIGSLFNRPFKRILVKDHDYLIKLIHYIHNNPVKHGYSKMMEDWKYSSYQAFISDLSTLLNKEEVLDLFDDLENFIYCHKYSPELNLIDF